MPRRHLVLLGGLALVALLVGSAWRLMPTRGGADLNGGRARTEHAQGIDSAARTLQPPTDPRTAADAAGDEGRSTVTAADAGELARALWVEGRVLFPTDTPSDEETWVEALLERNADEGWHRVRVAADGAFRVAFPAGAQKGWLDVDGRYLYLEAPARVTPGRPPADLELEPGLGAWIQARLVLPAGVAPEEAVGLSGRLLAMEQTGPSSWRTRLDRELVTRGPLLEARGVLPSERVRLELEADPFLEIERDNLVPVPGRRIELELVLELGAEVVGHLTDEDGAVIARAQVVVHRAGHNSWTWRQEVLSDEEGAFRIGGIATSAAIGVIVRKEGYTEFETEVGPLVAGVPLALDVTLARGLGLAGSVRWPDGSPVTSGWIEARPEDDDDGDWIDEEKLPRTKLASDGTFELQGIEGGRWRLHAWAPRPLERAAHDAVDESALSLRERRELRKRRRDRPVWHARAEGLAAGTTGIELALAAGAPISGRVVDDRGLPVGRFVMMALPLRPEIPSWRRENLAQSESFESEEGLFELTDVEHGEWELRPAAPGHARPAPTSVSIPGATAVTVVLPRAAVVRGRVLDPRGLPVPDARVRASARMVGLGGQQDQESESTETDDEGQFELDRVQPSAVSLRATAPGWAPGLDVRLQLEPGQVVDGIDIELGRGGTLTGEVVRAGRPIPDRNVTARLRGTEEQYWTESDQAGAFLFGSLPAGNYELTSYPTDEEREEAGDREGEVDHDVWRELILSASVTVAEGETVHVTLGAGDPEIRVSGVVRAGGDPVGEVSIQIEPHGRRDWKNRVNAQADAEGRYELTLSQGGEYLFVASSPAGGWVRHRQMVTIPEGAGAVTVDVDLPTGILRGRVVHTDGSPAEGLFVAPSSEGLAYQPLGGFRGVPTHSNGSFELVNLAPGDYVLEAGAGGGAQRGRVAGIRLDAGEERSGIEIVVGPTGRVEGTVVDANGSPIAARVLAFDESGRALDAHLTATSGEDGRFELGPLPAGRLEVRAAVGGLVTTRAAVARVEPDRSTVVQLVVEPGTTLVVDIFDAQGDPAPASIAVLDSRGVDHAQVWGWWSLPTGLRQRAGPIPPGTYRVSAELLEGGLATELVTLDGEAERALVLQAH